MSESANPKTPYRVLARKYRPHNFDDLIGQAPMVQTLSNAFKTGRIAQAYMLTGVRGVGKTTTARILARALNYKNGDIDEPSIDLKEEGEHCSAIIEGRHMDVIEMDAASHTGIDDIRDLIESAQYRPATARYKVYIIDEVHMLSKNAFNGLLKTLEEPPEHLKFIFATTEIRKVPVTVLSRCQRFDLRRIDSGELAGHLANICKAENVSIEADALAIVARASGGSARDALSMLDQAIAHGAGDDVSISAEAMRSMLGLSDRARVVDLFEHIMKGDIASALGEFKAQYDIGAEPQVVLTDLADFIHLVTRLKYVPETETDRGLSEIERTKGKEFSEQLSVRVLGRAWQILLKGLSEVAASERPFAAGEMVLVRLTHASSLPTPDEVIKATEKNEIRREPPLSGGDRSGSAGGDQPAQASRSTDTSGLSHRLSAPSDQPRMSSRPDGSNVVAMVQPSANTLVSEVAEPGKVINSFDELIFLIEDKRDLAIKTLVKRHVRPVTVSDGRMEMNLVKDPPRDFLPVLGKRLEEWTGKRWVLSISQEEGAPTLAELEEQENTVRMDDAKSDPTVQAILEKFPGSRIVDIRVREEVTEEGIEPAPDDDNGLDEFF